MQNWTHHYIIVDERKSKEEMEEEGNIIKEMMGIVSKRDTLIAVLEEDRIRCRNKNSKVPICRFERHGSFAAGSRAFEHFCMFVIILPFVVCMVWWWFMVICPACAWCIDFWIICITNYGVLLHICLILMYPSSQL